MSASTTAARRLIERTGSHLVVSVYFSLDPSEFATAPARQTEIDSLLDEAGRQAKEAEESLDHESKMALRADLQHIREYLEGDEMGVSDRRATGIFASGADGLFETIALPGDVGPAAAIDEHPVIEPLVVASAATAWCAVLPSLDRADVYLGSGDRVTAHQHDEEYVRGHSAQGGPTGHDEEQDAENHLIALARRLELDWREGRFSILALGGPVQALTAFEKLMGDELRQAMLPERLDVDPSAAGESQIGEAVGGLVAGVHAREQARLLETLTSGIGEAQGSDRPARAVLGLDGVRQALLEQRVGTLLLAHQFTGAEREETIRAAVLQGAQVAAFSDDVTALGPERPVAALLRF